MLKIGEFATLAQISIRMLRHYDDLGLLKPTHIDSTTGYRYYALEQLPRLNRILALKDLGLSLDEIRFLLDHSLSAEEISGMLKLKQAQLRQHIRAEQARLMRVENRLRQIESEGELPEAEIVMKTQPAFKIVSLLGSGYPGHLFRNLLEMLHEQHLMEHTRGYITLYHGSLDYQRTGKREGENRIEVGCILSEEAQAMLSAPITESLNVRNIPAYTQVASLVSTRPDNERWLDARMLWHWMQHHQYHLIAPSRELYLRRPRPGGSENYITEMLFPIESLAEEEK